MKFFKVRRGSFSIAFFMAFLIMPFVSFSEEVSEKPFPPPPNLTINFKLNSALNKEYTAYYNEIVKEVLKHLPSEVALSNESTLLLSGETKYDHLKVVAYLPKTSDDENDFSQNEIRYFDVRFKAPADAVQVEETVQPIKEVRSDILKNAIVVHKGRNLEEFMKKVELVKAGGELPAAAVSENIVELTTKPKSEEVVEQNVSLTMFEKELAKFAKEGKVSFVDDATEEKGSDKKALNLKDDKTEKVVKSLADKPKTKIVSYKIIKNAELKFFGSENVPSKADVERLKSFASSLKAANSKGVRIISYTMPSLEKKYLDVYKNRLSFIKEIFAKEGLDVKKLKFSEIRLKATFLQSIKLEKI